MWERFKIYEKCIVVFLLCNIIVLIFNDSIFSRWIPKRIEEFSFWLSLGLYLGFQICGYEIKRVMKNKKSC